MLTSYEQYIKFKLSLNAGDRNRTGTVLLRQDFKSCASASSATPAYRFSREHEVFCASCGKATVTLLRRTINHLLNKIFFINRHTLYTNTTTILCFICINR